MIRVPLFLLVLLGAAAIAEAGAQSRRHEEETVRGLDDRERIAALNRDVPALETFPEEVNAPSAR
jgi:hypothetical protein